MLDPVTKWSERLASYASWMRASPKRCAAFLIAVFVFANYQSRLGSWLWTTLFGSSNLFSELTWRDYLTWNGIRDALQRLPHNLTGILGIGSLALLCEVSTCVLAVLWLHGTTPRGALAKLGLPKPRRIEFTVPLVVAIPGFVWAMFYARDIPVSQFDSQEAQAFDFGYVSGGVFRSWFSALLMPFGSVLTYGLLYKGLREDARWSHRSTLVALVGLTTLMPWLLMGLSGETWFSSGFLALAILSTLLTAWIFVQWNLRLWVLVVLAFGQPLTSAFIPVSVLVDAPAVSIVLSLEPYLLLAGWTWLIKRRERTSPTAEPGR